MGAVLVGGCQDGTQATLTIGPEGFAPAIVRVPAGESFDLKVVNDSRAVQTIKIADRPGLRIDAGQTSTRQVAALEPGDHEVTMEGAPFQATLRAEE